MGIWTRMLQAVGLETTQELESTKQKFIANLKELRAELEDILDIRFNVYQEPYIRRDEQDTEAKKKIPEIIYITEVIGGLRDNVPPEIIRCLNQVLTDLMPVTTILSGEAIFNENEFRKLVVTLKRNVQMTIDKLEGRKVSQTQKVNGN